MTRPGGVVAVCVWDHAGGRGPLSIFWSAVAEVDPGARDEGSLMGSTEGQLVTLLGSCGLDDVVGGEVTATRAYTSFEDWWEPYTLGVGPAGDYVRSIDDADSRPGHRGVPDAGAGRGVHAGRDRVGGAWEGAVMITAMHALVYSDDAAATRAFFRDVLRWPFVSDDEGSEASDWLIFRSGRSEVGVHPTSGGDWSTSRQHTISLLCDDLEATVAELRGRGAVIEGEPADRAVRAVRHGRGARRGPDHALPAEAPAGLRTLTGL